MKKDIIGYMPCPLDGVEGHVKQDKNGDAFFFCPDCTVQIFTRNANRDALMRKKMRPITVTVTDTEQEPAAQTEPSVTDTPPARPKGEAGKPAPVPPKKAAPEVKKKSGWLTPILSGDSNG